MKANWKRLDLQEYCSRPILYLISSGINDLDCPAIGCGEFQINKTYWIKEVEPQSSCAGMLLPLKSFLHLTNTGIFMDHEVLY